MIFIDPEKKLTLFFFFKQLKMLVDSRKKISWLDEMGS